GFGALIHMCASAEEAQEFLEAHRSRSGPTVVLLDVNMPGMSGFDLLYWIRENFHSSTPRLKAVMWSNSGDDEDQRRAGELGATAYLTKFASSAILGAVINECLAPTSRSTQSAAPINGTDHRTVETKVS